MLYVGNIIEILSDGSSWLFDELVEFQFELWIMVNVMLLSSIGTFSTKIKFSISKASYKILLKNYGLGISCFQSQTKDAQRENSFHCTAKNSLQLPNF